MHFRVLILVVALAALGAGFWAAWRHHTAMPETGAIVYAQPRDPGDFTLVDHRGDAFTPDRIDDGWTLWFFGFTHCPDVCPMTLATLDLADQALAEAGAVRPQVVMVSVDPARDTPAVLAGYVPFFNDEFLGVTGAAGQIHPLARRLGIIVQYQALEGDEYTVDHGAALLLSGPDGLVRAQFQAPHEPQALARDLAVLIPWLERQL